jgi:hypothetical protein
MPPSTLAEVLRDARALSPEDQYCLRVQLDAWLHATSPTLTEAAFEHYLMRQGIVSTLPSPAGAPGATRTRIVVQGPPLSETLIEDRG